MAEMVLSGEEGRRKVFNRGLCICAGGLDILKINKKTLICSASCFNLGGI